MKKNHFLLLFSLLLSSCQKTEVTCYQCFYGKEIPVSFSLPYRNIQEKELQNNLASTEKSYYFNSYLMENDEEKDSFLKMVGLSYSSSDVQWIDFKKNPEAKLVFFFQIPKGYDVSRRENLQEKEDGNEIFITPSFYFYHKRENISYFFLDLVKDPEKKEDHIYSTLVFIRSSMLENLKNSNIRGILSKKQ